MTPGTPDLMLMVTGTGTTPGRGAVINACRQRKDPYTERVEYVEEPGGLFWGPKINTGYISRADKSGTAGVAKTSGLANARRAHGTFVLVKVST